MTSGENKRHIGMQYFNEFSISIIEILVKTIKGTDL